QADQSKSVQVLRENETLRQGIIAYVFGPLTDRKEILNLRVEKFAGHLHSHSGLHLWRKVRPIKANRYRCFGKMKRFVRGSLPMYLGL
ncbi:hypothetical protein CQA09_28525, partial [Klebsiella pneumoniae]